MASSKKRSRRIRAAMIVVVCILLVCAVALGTVYTLLSRKVKALQQGAAFSFDYAVTSVSEEPSTLYRLLDEAGAVQGQASGLYASGRLQLTLAAQGSAAEPLTRLYIDADETLYDVGQLYSTIRRTLVEQYPLASLLPNWTLGDYISQTQLAQALGIDPASVELQGTTGFVLDLRSLKKVQPANAKEGYLYLSLPNRAENGPELVLGLPTDSLFADVTPLHVLLSLPEQGISLELTGSLSAAEAVIVVPDSRMQDADIATFAQIRQAVTDLLAMIRNAAEQFPPAQS